MYDWWFRFDIIFIFSIIIIIIIIIVEGINEFSAVIIEESNRLDPSHPSLFPKLLNAAICISLSSLSSLKNKGREYLVRATEITQNNPDLFNDDTRSHVKSLLQQIS